MEFMLDLITALVLAFFAGIAVKTVDWIDDERKGKYSIKWPLAIIYGGLIGFLISQASFSTIFLAALFAQVFARKIDTHTHVLGFGFAVLSLVYLGFPSLDISLFGFFILLAFMDEARYFGRLKGIIEYRPFLKLGALLMVLFGRIDYFLGIMVFDIAYMLTDYSLNRFFKLNRA
jgi:hypothetical protein